MPFSCAMLSKGWNKSDNSQLVIRQQLLQLNKLTSTFRQVKASPHETWYVLIIVLKLKTHRACSLLLILVLCVLGSKAEESGQTSQLTLWQMPSFEAPSPAYNILKRFWILVMHSLTFKEIELLTFTLPSSDSAKIMFLKVILKGTCLAKLFWYANTMVLISDALSQQEFMHQNNWYIPHLEPSFLSLLSLMSQWAKKMPHFIRHWNMCQSESSWDQHILPSRHLYAELNNILCYFLTPELKPCSCSTFWVLTTAATCRLSFTGILAPLLLEIPEKDAVKQYKSHSACKFWLCFCWNMVC